MKFKALLTNELIKLFRRTSTKVIVIIALVAAVISSLAGFGEENDLFGVSHYSNAYTRVREVRDRCESLGIDERDWRYDTLVSSIVNNVYDVTNLESNISYYEQQLSDGVLNDEDEKKTYQTEIASEREQIKQLEAEIEELWAQVEKNDFKGAVKARAEGVYANLDHAVDAVNEKEKAINECDLDEAEAAAAARCVEEARNTLSALRKAADAACERDISASSHHFRMMTVLPSIISELELRLPADRLAFGNLWGRYEFYAGYFGEDETVSYSDYKSYLNSCRKQLSGLTEKAMIARYSFEHDSAEITTANGSRMHIRSLVSGVFFGILSIIGIYVACVAVASEFSRKTINMLVIRPVSRRAITLSKYAACLAVVYGTMFAGIVLGLLFTGVGHGFADLFEPMIFAGDGNAYAVPFVLWFIGKALLGSLSVVFFTTFAFLFAMLTRHTTASVIISFVLYAFSPVLQLVRGSIVNDIAYSLGVSSGSALFSKLPLSYINMNSSVFDNMPVLYERYDMSDLFSRISVGGTDLLFGSIALIVMIAVMYFIADRSFARKDVK